MVSFPCDPLPLLHWCYVVGLGMSFSQNIDQETVKTWLDSPQSRIQTAYLVVNIWRLQAWGVGDNDQANRIDAIYGSTICNQRCILLLSKMLKYWYSFVYFLVIMIISNLAFKVKKCYRSMNLQLWHVFTFISGTILNFKVLWYYMSHLWIWNK